MIYHHYSSSEVFRNTNKTTLPTIISIQVFLHGIQSDLIACNWPIKIMFWGAGGMLGLFQPKSWPICHEFPPTSFPTCSAFTCHSALICL